MQRTRIKICGITRAEDARLAAGLGADAIGLNFVPGTARCLAPSQAAAIVGQLPPFVTALGVFADARRETVEAVLREVPLQGLQFHGSEESAFCAAFGLPFVQAIRVSSQVAWETELERTQAASALLLDTLVPGIAGGTGVSFDWSLVPSDLGKPVILAGGLHAGNVGQAIRQVRPYAVDVSGGVESSKGIKDAARMRAFFAAVGATGDE